MLRSHLIMVVMVTGSSCSSQKVWFPSMMRVVGHRFLRSSFVIASEGRAWRSMFSLSSTHWIATSFRFTALLAMTKIALITAHLSHRMIPLRSISFALADHVAMMMDGSDLILSRSLRLCLVVRLLLS
jgi:hypothetical protein